MNKISIILLFTAIFLLSCMTNGNDDTGTVPLIYCTDLYHPHQDPDDHFDLAAIYAMREFKVEAIILDDGDRQEQTPGAIPIDQLNRLTGRNVPYAIGLAEKLKSPGDTAAGEPEKYQGGVNMILEILEKAEKPVTVITVGSVRDVAAAYNRNPELLKNKIDKIMIFIGEAKAGFNEYNVRLDENAFVRIMNSGLPVYWVPCFDKGAEKGERYASYWTATHEELLRSASDPVINFFTYALLHKDEENYTGCLYNEVDPGEKEQIMAQERNLWCTAVFTYAAGRKFVLRNEEWIAVPENGIRAGDIVDQIFTFSPVLIFAQDKGEVLYEETGRSHVINRFRVLRRDIYYQSMTSVTRNLIGELSDKIASKQN
ncbi:nucleoside hydrolase [candidate division KSB1 bacterium]